MKPYIKEGRERELLDMQLRSDRIKKDAGFALGFMKSVGYITHEQAVEIGVIDIIGVLELIETTHMLRWMCADDGEHSLFLFYIDGVIECPSCGKFAVGIDGSGDCSECRSFAEFDMSNTKQAAKLHVARMMKRPAITYGTMEEHIWSDILP